MHGSPLEHIIRKSRNAGSCGAGDDHAEMMLALEEKAAEATERTWEWRNLRQVGVGVTIWPFDWGFGFTRWSDRNGGTMELHIGPFDFVFSFNAGVSGIARLAAE